LSAEHKYKTLNNFDLIISEIFEIWCSGARVTEDTDGFFFDVIQYRLTSN